MSNKMEELERSLEEAIATIQSWEKSDHGQKTLESSEKLEALESQLDSVRKALETQDKRQGRTGFLGASEVESIGQEFVKSDAFGRMQSRKGQTCDPVAIPGGFFNFYKSEFRKDLSGALQSATTGAGLVAPMRIPGVVQRPLRTPRIRELLPTFPTESNTIEYVEETGFNQLYAQSTVPVLSGDMAIQVDNVSGFYKTQVVTFVDPAGLISHSTTMGAVPDIANKVLFLTDPFPADFDLGTAVTSDTYIFTAETTLKPKARLTYAEQTANVKTLASWLPATRQILSDSPQLQSIIDGRLVESLMLNEERQLLYGDGTSLQLQGIMSAPGTNSYAWSSGVPGDAKVDAIRRAMTLSALAHYPVDGIILNPLDWADIELAKGTDGHYLLAPVMSGAMTMAVWRVPVVVTTAINPTDFLVGAFSLGAAIYDREEASVRVAEQHEDFFVRNMVVILAEERLAFIVYRPESFVVGTFDAAP